MAESAALLVDEVFPHQPVRQWVLSFPFQLRFLFASRPVITGQVLGIVNRVIAMHLVKKASYSRKAARTGAVTLIQRFGRSGVPEVEQRMEQLPRTVTWPQMRSPKIR